MRVLAHGRAADLGEASGVELHHVVVGAGDAQHGDVGVDGPGVRGSRRGACRPWPPGRRAWAPWRAPSGWRGSMTVVVLSMSLFTQSWSPLAVGPHVEDALRRRARCHRRRRCERRRRPRGCWRGRRRTRAAWAPRGRRTWVRAWASPSVAGSSKVPVSWRLRGVDDRDGARAAVGHHDVAAVAATVVGGAQAGGLVGGAGGVGVGVGAAGEGQGQAGRQQAGQETCLHWISPRER